MGTRSPEDIYCRDVLCRKEREKDWLPHLIVYIIKLNLLMKKLQIREVS